jgi:biotin carboxyl carrier protein
MKQKEKMGVLNIDSTLYKTRISRMFETRKFYKAVNPRLVLSFIPGTVLDILVKQGQIVKKGEDLMILEAMKMQNQLKSSMDGKVKSISVKKGDKVSKGTILLELE